MTELYIKCKYIISGSACEKVIKNGGILIENGRIISVGNEEEVKKSSSTY